MIRKHLPLFACLLAILHPVVTSAAGGKPGKPNFLFILVDDLGIHDLGIEGSTFYETPNIDALAASSERFANGYAACEVCSPSRASIMLGKAPPRHGITTYIGDASGMARKHGDPVNPAEYRHDLSAADTTLAEALRDGGYKTFFAGKWHLGGKGSWPEDHGFDINIGGWDAGSPVGGYFSPWKNPNLPDGPKGESLTLRLADETAKFIGEKHDKPFLAYLSFYAVHCPLETTEALCHKYQEKAKRMGLTTNKKRFKFDRRLPVRQVQDNPVYAGMMETLDDAVGIVLDKLKETGLDKNTVVIFTGDNGGLTSGDTYSTCALPLRGGKGRQWEGGIREPFYIRVPGMTKPGAITQVPAIGMDFFPTMLELAGLPLMPKQHVDGVSLVPVLKGGALPDRDLFWHFPHYGNQGGEPASIIRSKDWKLIFYHEDGRYELYNIAEDIGEKNDLAAKQPERVAAMKKRLDAWLKDTGAVMPDPNPRYNKAKFEARLENARTKVMQKLEKESANLLNPEWKPNADWWSSSAAESSR